MESIVKIENLNYSYSSGQKILENVNLELFSNEIFVLLGHNGAGKTTLIRLILDFHRGYSGGLEVFGRPPEDCSARNRVGFMSEQPVIYEFETAKGYLDYFSDLSEIPRKNEKIKELMSITGLDQHKDKKLSQYSKGMLQRLNLARALLNDPDLLIMDEPVMGLDPLGQELVEKVVKERKAAGKSVFINTHAVSFAAKLADRVGFLMGGRLRKIYSRKDFEKGSFPYIYEILFANDTVAKQFEKEFVFVSHQEMAGQIMVNDQTESEKLLGRVVSTSSRVLHVAANQEVLEKAFLDYSKDLSLEDRSR